MGLSIAKKIIRQHLIEGEMIPGAEVTIRIDQTLTQDSTGTMAYLQLEAMDVDQVKTQRSVAYIDHNMLQEGFENADDHKYIQTAAHKHGIYFSRPGNGICHQVHLERFGVPGQTLLGSDSHTPTCGGIGMLAIGAGGLDVAVAMGSGAYAMIMPKIVNIRLTGRLKPYVAAKDIILEVLRRLSVKGGVGKIMEYTGDGAASLTVPERSTITNMGAELGATTSVFPSDAATKAFLKAQRREASWIVLAPDPDAEYDETVEIDLNQLRPLAAAPHSPDHVKPVSDIAGIHVDQVAIGSCTNSSYQDMMKTARLLKGQTIAPHVSLVVSPGSKQVLTMLAQNGALADIIDAGARILESGCGPCIGMGQSPATNGISLRTFNRNFKGRCGTDSAQVYLVSTETAVASAIAGRLTDPAQLTHDIRVDMPETFWVHDNMIIPPSADPQSVEVVRGPNIKPFPLNTKLPPELKGEVLLKLGDHITTDQIMPSNARLLPYRSNIPFLSEYCMGPCDETFPARAKAAGGGFIVGGENYGQGSSREHAALAPLFLGIKAVLVKSFARIHKSNLINSGILPLTFKNAADYDAVHQGDILTLPNVVHQIQSGGGMIIQTASGKTFEMDLSVTKQEREMLLLGGKINQIRQAAVPVQA